MLSLSFAPRTLEKLKWNETSLLLQLVVLAVTFRDTSNIWIIKLSMTVSCDTMIKPTYIHDSKYLFANSIVMTFSSIVPLFTMLTQFVSLIIDATNASEEK